MPRLAVFSDLHLEVGPYDHPLPDADVLVLAGDIGTKQRGVEWAAAVADGRPVVYVPGNHEPWGEKLPRHTEELRELGAASGVHVLDRAEIVLCGVRFLGATLWTDFAVGGSVLAGKVDAGRLMNDYKRIRVAPTYRRLGPNDTAMWHALTVRWLEAALAVPFEGPTVIVTHHAPSLAGVSPGERGDALTPAYASALDGMVARCGAALWVHGHTHFAHDTQIGGTRLLSNPRGYIGELVHGFRSDLVVTV